MLLCQFNTHELSHSSAAQSCLLPLQPAPLHFSLLRIIFIALHFSFIRELKIRPVQFRVSNGGSHSVSCQCDLELVGRTDSISTKWHKIQCSLSLDEVSNCGCSNERQNPSNSVQTKEKHFPHRKGILHFYISSVHIHKTANKVGRLCTNYFEKMSRFVTARDQFPQVWHFPEQTGLYFCLEIIIILARSLAA